MFFTGKKLQHYLVEELRYFLVSDENQTCSSPVLDNKRLQVKKNKDDVKHRKDMSEIICEEPSGEQNILKEVVTNWLDPKNCIESNKNIAIVGQTQIGKSFVLKNLLLQLKQKKLYEYIFLVSLKTMNLSKELNVLQFLTNNNVPVKSFNNNSSVDQEICNGVIAKLSFTKNEKVCIIFEDLEKSNLEYDENNIDAYEDNYTIAKPTYFFIHFLRKRFRNACNIFLLTPWHYFLLNQSFDLNPIFVHGLNHEKQKDIIMLLRPEKGNSLGCNKNECFLQQHCLGIFLEKHATNLCSICEHCHDDNCHLEMQSMCYVPSNCKFLIENDALHSKPFVVIAASLLISKIEENLKHPVYSREFSVAKVSRFAWKQIKNKKFLFHAKDLKSSDLNQKEIGFFFSAKQISESVGGLNNIVYFFSHLLLQEFLAAQWLLSRPQKIFKRELNCQPNEFFSSKSKKFFVLREFMSKICSHPCLENCRNSGFWKINNNYAKYIDG